MSAKFSKSTLDRIRERTDMVQLVSEYVQLQQRGPDDHWGCCPFHQEKSPSFHIRPGRGMYKCFGCGKGGDVFRFLEEADGLSFPEAVRRLAERTGVELEAASPRDREEQERRAALLRTSELACAFFEEVLWSATPAGDKGRSYLERRGIEPATARSFRLGLAPDDPGALLAFARRRSASPRALEELGLVRQGQSGRPYGFFRDRLMFPIADEQGKVIAFGGRTLGDDPRKYMNSPEVPAFYEKRRVLYGLDRARKARPRRLVVVEGYMDVVVPHQAGRTEFVAALGTAFTPEQARLARRYVDEVVLLFDADAAGTAAAQRALASLVEEQGLTVRVAGLPGGLDPDEVVRQDPALLDRCLDEAQDVISYLIARTLEGRQLGSAEAEALAKKAAIRLLGRIPDDIRLFTELGRVAERFGLPEDVLRDEALRARQERRREGQGGRVPSRGRDDDYDAPRGSRPAHPAGSAPGRGGKQHQQHNVKSDLEIHLLEALLALPEGARLARERGLQPEAFQAPVHRLIAGAIFADERDHGGVEAARVMSHMAEPEARHVLGELIGSIDPQKNYQQELEGVSRLLDREYERRSAEIMRELKLARSPAAQRELLEEKRRLDEQRLGRGAGGPGAPDPSSGVDSRGRPAAPGGAERRDAG